MKIRQTTFLICITIKFKYFGTTPFRGKKNLKQKYASKMYVVP